MVMIEKDLYVTVREQNHDRAPQPRPLQNGFSLLVAYRVLGLHSASETSEAYLILANDRDEMWFISNRHLRVHGIFPQETLLRFPVARHLAAAGSMQDLHVEYPGNTEPGAVN
ncbi:MAG: hypothetical protein ABIS45_15355 [Burkholderiales bacterium]